MLRARVSRESSRSPHAGIGFTLGCCRSVCWCVGLLFGLSTRANRGACPNRAGEENRGTRSVVSRTPHRHHPTYEITPDSPDYPRPPNKTDRQRDHDAESFVSRNRGRLKTGWLTVHRDSRRSPPGHRPVDVLDSEVAPRTLTLTITRRVPPND